MHVLAAGRPLMLCGVAVPHDKGLAGHSDADVGIHALCDAIYGALAEGDIGRHFPPSEATWKDADSARFLTHAAGRIAARGGMLVNADVTLICERPKIAPHAEAMRARLAALLGGRCRPRLGQGHHDRKARLHRAWRGHRRPGRRHRPAAPLIRLPSPDPPAKHGQRGPRWPCLGPPDRGGAKARDPMTKPTLAVVLLGASLLAGCATQNTPTAAANPFPPVPPPMTETIPKPPVSGEQLLWQPGHWDWNGSGYVWQPGEVRARRRPRRAVPDRLLAADPVRLGLGEGALDQLIALPAAR